MENNITDAAKLATGLQEILKVLNTKYTNSNEYKEQLCLALETRTGSENMGRICIALLNRYI